MSLKNLPLKPKLVVMLGGLYYVIFLCMQVEHIVHNAPVIYIISTFLQYTLMITAMNVITLGNKKLSLILVISAMALMLINQYVIPYGGVDPIIRTLYYFLEYILLFVYIRYGNEKNRNSLIWCGLFLVAVCYSVYEVAEVLTLRDLVFLTLYLSFYLVAYSPDKWYKRKKSHNKPAKQAEQAG